IPGASCRRTGSATRWNSFQPAFMRQGSDHPFKVTTGLYGRPVLGTSGGAISAVSRIGASGSEAAPALETMAAPNSPAAEARMNCLLLVMSVSPAGSRGRRRCSSRHLHCSRRAPGERHLQIGFGKPELARRLDVAVDRG